VTEKVRGSPGLAGRKQRRRGAEEEAREMQQLVGEGPGGSQKVLRTEAVPCVRGRTPSTATVFTETWPRIKGAWSDTHAEEEGMDTEREEAKNGGIEQRGRDRGCQRHVVRGDMLDGEQGLGLHLQPRRGRAAGPLPWVAAVREEGNEAI
jgi:hypothetical protein